MIGDAQLTVCCDNQEHKVEVWTLHRTGECALALAGAQLNKQIDGLGAPPRIRADWDKSHPG